MFLAARNHVVTDRSLIDTMKLFHGMGYGGLELSVVRGMTNILAWDYLDDHVINKVNEVSEESSFPIAALACHANYATSDHIFAMQKRLIFIQTIYRMIRLLR